MAYEINMDDEDFSTEKKLIALLKKMNAIKETEEIEGGYTIE